MPASSQPSNPTLRTLFRCLRSVAPRHPYFFDDPPPRCVVVNGVRVPIVRLEDHKVDLYFQRLYDLSNRLHFGGRLADCDLVWNRRFRNLGGRIDCGRRVIELSAAHFEACGVAALGVVLIHEQIHLSLFLEKKPFGHTSEFKRLATALGQPEIRHRMPLPRRLARRRPILPADAPPAAYTLV
ncbi:MAG: SprT-like domain-containing protein [Planctomycetia bacterium]